MEFKKYTSIDNSYKQKTVNYINDNFPTEEFVVQEKVHGANFAFYIDESGIKMAKRSGFLRDDENFYNCDVIKERYKEDLEFLQLLINKSEGMDTMSIHGEIYGGSYPHNDVEKVKDIQKVQNKCFYSPEAEFIVFDMKVNGEYISNNAMHGFLGITDIPVSKTLFRGSLTECLEYPNDNLPLLPTERGYPAIEGNMSEGVVIKSNAPLRLPSGDRAILKNKNAAFSEKKSVSKTPTVYSDELQKQIDEASRYITENRLSNVISKIGQVEEVNQIFKTLMGPFIQDIMQDFSDENEEFNLLSKEDRKVVAKKVNGMVSSMLRSNLQKIINGDL